MAKIFKVQTVEAIRPETYRVYITRGRENDMRVIVYPRGPMLILCDDPTSWLESDLTDSQKKLIRQAIRKFERS